MQELLQRSSRLADTIPGDANARLFDRLCRIATEVAQPVVRDALIRATLETGATAWLNEAEQVLAGILVEPQILEDVDHQELRQALCEGLKGSVPLPDRAAIHEHAHDFACMMIRAWLDLLGDALSKAPSVELTDDLLPPQDTAGWEFWRGFAESIGPFAVDQKDAGEIRQRLRKRLLTRPGDSVSLPFNVCLKLEGNGSHDGRIIALHQLYDAAVVTSWGFAPKTA